MSAERYVNTLKPGDLFRDWLIDIAGDNVHDKHCRVKVYKVPASHTVCRYEFAKERYSVFAKFYGEPRGGNVKYNAGKAMDNEFKKLKLAQRFINIPRPLAKREKFNCVLVTECISGKTLSKYINSEEKLYDKLTILARSLKGLHDGTRSSYKKDKEFANFHKVLNQVGLNMPLKERYDSLLGNWWYNERSNWPYGSMIHNDANPANYLFYRDKVFALDFESSWYHAHPVHDLGIVAAELKKYFGWNKHDPRRAEPYIGHFLWQYSKSEDEFYRVTRALPFFMSLGLLRMARWHVNRDQRHYLLSEAEACLRSGLS